VRSENRFAVLEGLGEEVPRLSVPVPTARNQPKTRTTLSYVDVLRIPRPATGGGGRGRRGIAAETKKVIPRPRGTKPAIAELGAKGISRHGGGGGPGAAKEYLQRSDAARKNTSAAYDERVIMHPMRAPRHAAPSCVVVLSDNTTRTGAARFGGASCSPGFGRGVGAGGGGAATTAADDDTNPGEGVVACINVVTDALRGPIVVGHGGRGPTPASEIVRTVRCGGFNTHVEAVRASADGAALGGASPAIVK
jgi:hypothetical protein